MFVICSGCGAGDTEPRGDAGAADATVRLEVGTADLAAPDPAVVSSLDECFADLTAPTSGWFIDIQSYATGDGRYRIRRARQPGDRIAVGETLPYDLVRFAVETETGVLCVGSPSALSYDFGHHNWNETMDARTPAASCKVHERAKAVAGLGLTWMDTLTILDPTDESVVEGPLSLTEAGCYTLPFNLNGCPGRTRTDH